MREWKMSLDNVIKNEKSFKTKFPNYPSEIRLQLKKAEFYRIKINKNGVSRVKNYEQL